MRQRGGSISRKKIFSGSRISGSGDGTAVRKSAKSEADRKILKAALKENTLLGALGAFELDEMIDYFEAVTLKQGERCDVNGNLCVVLDGAVELSASTGPGTTKGTNERFSSGGVFGQYGLFHDSCRYSVEGSQVVADRPTRMCKLKGTAYRQGMEFSRQQELKANMRLLSSIPIFQNLSVPERLQISDASQVLTYRADEVIVGEGEPGDHFYIVRSGGAAVTRGVDQDGTRQRIDYKYPGDYFGEASLLESQPRNATVVSSKQSTEVLCVDRTLFNQRLLGSLQDIMARSESTLQQQMLVTVPLLSELTADKRSQLASCLKLQRFADGTYIFRQGDLGDRMYIIKHGEVSVRIAPEDKEIDHLYIGQYFGERALLKEEPRMASIQAAGDLECYSLSKDDFESLALRKTVAWTRRWDVEDTRDVTQLQVLKMMGSGAFGKAWLVKHRQTTRSYALKALDKTTIKRQNWTAVVMREKDILGTLTPHPCVITMHNAFQSPTHLFMLMEIARGGELFQVLEKFDRFTPSTARFYCGCVVLAIGHLHKHGVIFRDLKPENLLLTDTGYLKLIDMGFAKRLGRGEKTYTLCGTPYYLAPEMILHRGHSFALDWWTVGVLTYEMLEGEPPFTGNSEMEVYGKVTRMQYACPAHFPETATDIVVNLLRKEPENRLGNLRNGVDDVMAHAWFYDLSWDELLDGAIEPPYVPPTPPDPGSTNDSQSSQHHGKLDLSKASKNPESFGYWPGWCS